MLPRISSSAQVRPAPPVVPSPSQQPNVYGPIGRSCSGYSSGSHTGTAWLVQTVLFPVTRSEAAISTVVTGLSSNLRRWLERPGASTRSCNAVETGRSGLDRTAAVRSATTMTSLADQYDPSFQRCVGVGEVDDAG